MKTCKIIIVALLTCIIFSFSIVIKPNEAFSQEIIQCTIPQACNDPDGPGPLEAECNCSAPIIECCINTSGLVIFTRP